MPDDDPPPGGGGGLSTLDSMNELEGSKHGAEVETSDCSVDPTTSSYSTTGAWASG